MKGYHHLVITFLSVLPPAIPWASTLTLSDAILLSLGLLAGSLAPDVDAKDAAFFHLPIRGGTGLRLLFAGLGYVLRYLIYYPLSLFFRIILRGSYRHEHRGLLHTPLGVILMTAILLMYLEIASLLLQTGLTPALMLFGIAFLGGSFLHLLEDSSTPAGIAWGFPFSDRRIRGRIPTMDPRDIRLLLLILLLGAIAIAMAYLTRTGLPGIGISAAAIALLVITWSIFFVVAGVER